MSAGHGYKPHLLLCCDSAHLGVGLTPSIGFVSAWVPLVVISQQLPGWEEQEGLGSVNCRESVNHPLELSDSPGSAPDEGLEGRRCCSWYSDVTKAALPSLVEKGWD